MKTINRLTGAAFGFHLSDQIALVCVPIAAALAFNASPEVIGLLVACQALAHLFGTLPFGVLVDRFSLHVLIICAALTSAIGFGIASVSIISNNVIAFAASVTLAGFGVVLFSLTALSIVPLLAKAGALAKSNATIEIPRTLCSFVVPLTIATIVTSNNITGVFMFAVLSSLTAVAFGFSLPAFKKPKQPNKSVLRDLIEGGTFVLRNEHLRAISACAVFWNVAFTALLVVMVPLLTTSYGAEPSAFGAALAAFGLGAICGTWIARQFSSAISPNVLLVFGPAISVVASLILYFGQSTGSVFVVYGAFALFGFGPSMWLITQNTVRQLVTPAEKLGRVNAVIQTAIYGMRPLGALAGGVIVGKTTPQFGLLVVASAFFVSCVVSIFSQLIKVTSYKSLRCVAST